jgi:hypothetical protein
MSTIQNAPALVFIIILSLPITLWATTPCEQATQNVIKVYHLRQTLSEVQQKTSFCKKFCDR